MHGLCNRKLYQNDNRKVFYSTLPLVFAYFCLINIWEIQSLTNDWGPMNVEKFAIFY